MNEVELLNAGYRYAWSLCGNRQDAEDLVQDAWCRLVKRYRRTPEKSLLFTTVRNIYIDSYRHNTRFPRISLQDHHLSEGTDYLSAVDSEDAFAEAESLQLQLNRLRDKEREALFLSVVEGYTAEEIALMTNSARGSVLSLLHRAKAKLRKWLSDDEGYSSNVVPLNKKRGRQL